MGDIEAGVQLCSVRALNAVVGPKLLEAEGGFDGVGKRMPGVGAGEGDVAARVPVLGEDDVVETGGEGVDAGNDGVAIGDGQSSAGKKIKLHIDDEKRVCGTCGA